MSNKRLGKFNLLSNYVGYIQRPYFLSADIFVNIQLICVYFRNRDKLMDGVVKDMQRQEQRRFENMYVLEQQMELTKKLQSQQGLVAEETWPIW